MSKYIPKMGVQEIAAKIERQIEEASAEEPIGSNPLNETIRESTQAKVLTEKLTAAEAHGNTIGSLPSMEHHPFYVRWLARLTGRLVLYLSKFVTVPQRRFNEAALGALLDLQGIVSSLGQNLSGTEAGISALREQTAQDHRNFASLQRSVDQLSSDLQSASETASRETGQLRSIVEERIDRLSSDLQSASETASRETAQLRSVVDSISPESERDAMKEGRQILGKLYRPFQDSFRGSRELIIDRQKVYLPFVKESELGSQEMPILDLGCGRGEWLQIVGEAGLQAVGVEDNPQMVTYCSNLGLQAIQSEALSFLKRQPDRSWGAVTAFHLIEHLPFEILLVVFAQIHRIIKPGGMLIVETPDPRNVHVGTHDFLLDPTHSRALPAPLVEFVLKETGWKDVHVMGLHPRAEEVASERASSSLGELSTLLWGFQDYAVLASKK